MESLRLPLFPEGSLSCSVITTVFVGVWVLCFFNLRLGWTLSGLVVPGYLVPLLLIKPWAAGIVVLEGVAAYLLVRLLAGPVGRLLGYCEFFGRDRFFALVLASVVVRLAGDAWLLPLFGRFLTEQFAVEFDYHNDLHSFGLIIVALIANQFWKPGLSRGLACFGVVLGVTFVLVRFVLMEFTNFSIGNLQYMYEDMASSLLASPKAYVIILTAAFLASWMNLYYSWEFNGILIPALMALQWYEPWRIVTSLAEAGVIFLIGSALLRAPGIRNISLEGARKILFFFTIGFAYKMVLGYAMPVIVPGVRVTDTFGFGYLFCTLLALKAHEKGIVLRMLRTTLYVSLAGAVAGSLVGFALTWVPSWLGGPAAVAEAEDTPLSPDAPLIDLLRLEKVSFYQKRTPNSVSPPGPHELEGFRLGLDELAAYQKERQPERLEAAGQFLHQANYRVVEVQQRYLFLHEAAPRRGWGVYVISLEHAEGLTVEVPVPLDEWATLESGALLFEKLQGGALGVAGSARDAGKHGSADVLRNPGTVFQEFHRRFGGANVLQVRGQPEEDDRRNALRIKNALPAGLDLSALRGEVGSFEVVWQAGEGQNAQRDASPTFGELFLNRPTGGALLVRAVRGTSGRATLERRDENVMRWLFASRERIAEAGTNLYQPPTQAEMLLFDEEVLAPLFHAMRTEFRDGQFTPRGRDELNAVAAAAAVFDYRLVWHHSRGGRGDWLSLSESETAVRRRCWGTCVFRLGASGDYLIQVPRPLFERNSFEYGVSLFDRLDAAAVVIAGTHRDANQDGSADPTHPRNRVNLFNLVSQVFLRETGDRPILVVQTRTLGVEPDSPPTTADVLVAFSDGSTVRAAMKPLPGRLCGVLEKDRLSVQFADGSPDRTGHEAVGSVQSSYLNQTANKELAVVWLSAHVRDVYRQEAQNTLQDSQFRALGVPTVEADLFDYLEALPAKKGSGELSRELRRAVEKYVVSKDVVALQAVLDRGQGLRFERVVDPDSQQSFLVVTGEPSRLPVVANLSAVTKEGHVVVTSEGVNADRVRHFITTRAAWLQFSEAP